MCGIENKLQKIIFLFFSKYDLESRLYLNYLLEVVLTYKPITLVYNELLIVLIVTTNEIYNLSHKICFSKMGVTIGDTGINNSYKQ